MPAFGTCFRGSILIGLTTAGLLLGGAQVRAADAPQERARAAAGADQERLTQRIEELKEKIGLLVKDQRFEQAEGLRRELNELQMNLEGRRAGRAPAVGDEESRRMQHLRVAIENLRMAGMAEAAQRLGQDLQRMEQEVRERAAQRQRALAASGVDPQVAELREQVQALRREVAELRETLKRLIGKQKP